MLELALPAVTEVESFAAAARTELCQSCCWSGERFVSPLAQGIEMSGIHVRQFARADLGRQTLGDCPGHPAVPPT